MIATAAEIKTLLGITSSDYDDMIDELLPLVQAAIVDYTNNKFRSELVSIKASTIAFVNGTPSTITDSGSGFLDPGNFLDAAQEIVVEGSKYNDGNYQVASVAAGVITLADGVALVDEAADQYVRISMVSWPPPLKQFAAKAIGYEINKSGSGGGVKSEKIGGYSVSYMTDEEQSKAVAADLSYYRRLSWE